MIPRSAQVKLVECQVKSSYTYTILPAVRDWAL